MIEVIIRHKGSQAELGRIEIENVSEGQGEVADYSVRFGVERIRSIGIHRRVFHNFPRTKLNVLALLLQALNTLDEDDFVLEGEFHENPLRKALGSIFNRGF